MAQRWLESGSFRVTWAGRGCITPKGIEVLSRDKPSVLVPLSDIERITQDGKYLRVYLPIDHPGFILVDSTGENYYPGLVLLSALRGDIPREAATAPKP
jgi:hypothetical protein